MTEIITPDNLLSFPIGTRVRFFYGCPVSTGASFDGPQEEMGLVVGHHADRWGACLIAETERGAEKRITRFVTAGIGAYRVG